MLVSNGIISNYQRSIISGLILFTDDLEEVKKRVEIVKEILTKYKDYFTNEQIAIIKILYRDYLKMNEDGYYAFGMSEISEKIFFKRYESLADEYIEILSYQPLIEELIKYYLKELEKKFIEFSLGVAI